MGHTSEGIQGIVQKKEIFEKEVHEGLFGELVAPTGGGLECQNGVPYRM